MLFVEFEINVHPDNAKQFNILNMTLFHLLRHKNLYNFQHFSFIY